MNKSVRQSEGTEEATDARSHVCTHVHVYRYVDADTENIFWAFQRMNKRKIPKHIHKKNKIHLSIGF